MATLRLRIGTPTVVTTDYSDVIDADTPLSHWRLGETTGTTIIDRAGGRHGQLDGTPTLGANSLVVSNAGNRAISFNGSTDRITTTRSSTFDFTGTAPFTVEAWVKPVSWDSNLRRIISHEDANHGWRLLTLNTAQHPRAIRFERTVAGVATMAQATDLLIRFTYHVVGVYTGTQLLLYVDGVQTTGDADSRGMPAHTGSLVIGDRS